MTARLNYGKIFLLDFFMTLDNIAALFSQPPAGAWSDRIRTPLGRRIPFIIIGAPITELAFGLIPLASAILFFVADAGSPLGEAL
ncbi:MAG: hypothetical protein IT314_03775 [Anaerolineales bacterium]|nr:hypothetical protein [Anaerolineales bacterium]